jgi:hypothetical protein
MIAILIITCLLAMISNCLSSSYAYNYCNGGAVYNNQTGDCDSCKTGEYSVGPYATECKQCQPFRVATISSGCGGLDPAQSGGFGSCTCDSYWIGLEASKANGIAIAMMIVYFLLVVYFIRVIITANPSISKYKLLKLAFTVLLSAVDTTTDLLYILTSAFGYPIFFALCIFFYLANIFAFLNYLRVHKHGIVATMFILPPAITTACNNNQVLVIMAAVPYYVYMVIKSIVLFFAGYCLYTSKLLMVGPIHNKFFNYFAQSNKFNSSELLDNESFTEGVYYELFFESLPQLVLQVLNWRSTYFGGSILVNKPLLASIISSAVTFIYHSVTLLANRCSCKQIKTGFEGMVYSDGAIVETIKVEQKADDIAVSNGAKQMQVFTIETETDEAAP